MFEIFLIVFLLGVLLLAFAAVQRMTTTVDKTFYKQQWRDIERKLSTGGELAHHAVTEADKLLDSALKQLNFKGETMADRLRSAGPSLKSRDNVWTAHKLRNRLVHETNMRNIKSAELKRALSSYRRALKDLGAL